MQNASSYGLGAVLLQLHKDDGWRPVAFASRALTETEARYAQIEKEAFALTWACEKFSDYILGKPILLETDHKPLVPILGSKSLETLPPRVLRFRLRLARFQYTVHYSPGKSLYLADTLSRAPLKVPSEGLNTLTDQEVENFVEAVVSSLPASADRINVYRQAQARDTECRTLIEYCKSGWPEKHTVKGELKRFWQVRGELTCSNDLLLFRSRIIVPKSLRGETLQKSIQVTKALFAAGYELQNQYGGQECLTRWSTLSSHVQNARKTQFHPGSHLFHQIYPAIHGKR